MLNFRFLTISSNDSSDDMKVLAHHHFLLGRSSIAIPHLPDTQKYLSHGKMFPVAPAHMFNMWSRWLKEYLPKLSIHQNRYRKRSRCKKMIWHGLSNILENEVFTALKVSKSVILGSIAIFNLVMS